MNEVLVLNNSERDINTVNKGNIYLFLFDHTPSRPLAYTGFCLILRTGNPLGIKPAPLLLSAAFLFIMYRFL